MMTYRFANRWPSITALAEDLGISYETAKGISHRERRGVGTIPDHYWLRAIAGAKRRKIRGVTLTALAEAAEQIHNRTRSADAQRAA